VFFHFGRLREVSEDRQVAGVSWQEAARQMETAKSLSSSFQSEDRSLMSDLERITAVGEELVGNADRRLLWLEIIKTVNETLPRTPGLKPGEIPTVEEVPFDQRHEIHVEKMETMFREDLSAWFTEALKEKYMEQSKEAPRLEDLMAQQEGGEGDANGEPPEPEGPTDEGWIVDLKCYHYFNSDKSTQGIQHALRTLVSNLKNGRVTFPVAADKIRPGVVVRHQDAQGRFFPVRVADMDRNGVPWQMRLEGVASPIPVAPDAQIPVVFTMREMGIDYPVVVINQRINHLHKVPNPNFEPPEAGRGGAGYGMGPGADFGDGMGRMGAGPPGGMYGGAGMMGPPGGMYGASGMRGGGTRQRAGAEGEDDEEREPPFLTVPIYNFSVQFCWQERLLSDRLQQQVDEWEPMQEEPAETTTPPGDDPSVAMRAKGGA
jgi:type IV pilus assembly protein PilM